MGLLGNGERRGWERIEVSGSRIWFLSLEYDRDTLAELLHLVLVLCASNLMIFSFMTLDVSAEQDQSSYRG